MNIATLAPCHGTDQFLQYVQSMNKAEAAVRAGTNFLDEMIEIPHSQSVPLPDEHLPALSTPVIPVSELIVVLIAKHKCLSAY